MWTPGPCHSVQSTPGDLEVEPESRAVNQSKATCAREGLAHEASRLWCAFQLGVEKHAQATCLLGPTPAAPTHFWVGLTVHGADGRFQHSVLGPWGLSRGCSCRTPVEEAPAALQKEGPCSPCAAQTQALCFNSETEDTPSAPPRQPEGINIPQNRRGTHGPRDRAGHAGRDSAR